MSSHLSIHSLQTAQQLRANHRADVDLAMAKRHFLKKSSSLLTNQQQHEDPHAMALRLFYQNKNTPSSTVNSKEHQPTSSSSSSSSMPLAEQKTNQNRFAPSSTTKTHQQQPIGASRDVDAQLKLAKQKLFSAFNNNINNNNQQQQQPQQQQKKDNNNFLLPVVESVSDIFLRKKVATLRITVAFPLFLPERRDKNSSAISSREATFRNVRTKRCRIFRCLPRRRTKSWTRFAEQCSTNRHNRKE
jgi:hypothetical protein